MSKVSIILPCYNVEKYIAKSIQSVLDQSYTDFELLVIIDGSPDNSKAIAKSFADSRITVYEKPNGGLSDARNYGLERANGEFVYFMDSDDWIEPYLVEKTIEVLEKQNLDLVVFGYIQDDEDFEGNLIGSKEIYPKSACLHNTGNELFLDYNLIGILGYAWNKVYRRSFLHYNNLFFEKGTSLVEDILFNSQVYIKTKTLCFLEGAFYHYLIRPEKTLSKQFHKNSYDLKVRKNESLEKFFIAWNIQNSKPLLSKILFGGIKNTANQLYYNDNLLKKEKLLILKNIFSHQRTKTLMPYFIPVNIKDLFLKFCVKFNLSTLFLFVSNLLKK